LVGCATGCTHLPSTTARRRRCRGDAPHLLAFLAQDCLIPVLLAVFTYGLITYGSRSSSPSPASLPSDSSKRHRRVGRGDRLSRL